MKTSRFETYLEMVAKSRGDIILGDIKENFFRNIAVDIATEAGINLIDIKEFDNDEDKAAYEREKFGPINYRPEDELIIKNICRDLKKLYKSIITTSVDTARNAMFKTKFYNSNKQKIDNNPELFDEIKELTYYYIQDYTKEFGKLKTTNFDINNPSPERIKRAKEIAYEIDTNKNLITEVQKEIDSIIKSILQTAETTYDKIKIPSIDNAPNTNSKYIKPMVLKFLYSDIYELI